MTPQDLLAWIDAFKGLGIGAAVVFVLVYYRDLVTTIIGGFFEVIYSRIRK